MITKFPIQLKAGMRIIWTNPQNDTEHELYLVEQNKDNEHYWLATNTLGGEPIGYVHECCCSVIHGG